MQADRQTGRHPSAAACGRECARAPASTSWRRFFFQGGTVVPPLAPSPPAPCVIVVAVRSVRRCPAAHRAGQRTREALLARAASAPRAASSNRILCFKESLWGGAGAGAARTSAPVFVRDRRRRWCLRARGSGVQVTRLQGFCRSALAPPPRRVREGKKGARRAAAHRRQPVLHRRALRPLGDAGWERGCAIRNKPARAQAAARSRAPRAPAACISYARYACFAFSNGVHEQRKACSLPREVRLGAHDRGSSVLALMTALQPASTTMCDRRSKLNTRVFQKRARLLSITARCRRQNTGKHATARAWCSTSLRARRATAQRLQQPQHDDVHSQSVCSGRAAKGACPLARTERVLHAAHTCALR